MKLHVQTSPKVFFVAFILCTVLLKVQSAPTPSMKDSLLVLPVVKRPTVPEGLLPTFDESPTIPQGRNKREIIFRPLFVYRQQQIKKHLVKNASKVPKSDTTDFNYYAGQYPTFQS